MPPVLPVSTPERLPKRARRRIGKLQAQAMQDLMMELDEAGEAATEAAAEAAMVCTRLYGLLSRRQQEDTDDVKPKEAAQWKVLRRRLQLAESRKWHKLVDELLDDLKSDEVAAGERRMRMPNDEQEAEEASTRKMRSIAVRKVRLHSDSSADFERAVDATT